MTPLSPLLLWECQISSYQLFAVRSSPLPAVALFISHHTDSRTDSWHSSFHFNVINKIKHDQTHVLNRAAKTAASWSWKIMITKRKPTVFVIEERKTYSVNWRGRCSRVNVPKPLLLLHWRNWGKNIWLLVPLCPNHKKMFGHVGRCSFHFVPYWFLQCCADKQQIFHFYCHSHFPSGHH